MGKDTEQRTTVDQIHADSRLEFQTTVLEGVDASNSGTHVIAHDGGSAQHLGDPMELDFDFDAISWAADLDSSAGGLEPDPSISYDAPNTGLPTDFLFAEDEGVLPTVLFDGQRPHAQGAAQLIHTTQLLPPPGFPATHSGTGFDTKHDGAYDNGLAHERLRRQLSLLSKGWAGDEIRFRNCDSSKAIVLHNLAMELGLGYNHNVRTNEVSMSRLEPQPASTPQLPPGRLSSSLSRSSTELDSALCLPGLPVFQPLRIPEFTTPIFETTCQQQQQQQQQPQQPQQQPTQQAAQLESAVKNEVLISRHPSRSERISDSISKHVSTLKTSISKGGRRGPLTENGRRDMRALEAVGGACWRCKVLRRKVTTIPRIQNLG